MRFPALVSPLARMLWHLPPSSRVRRAVVARAWRYVFEAANRRDLPAVFLLFHPDGESQFPSELGAVGMPTRTSGRAERMEAQRQWNEAWQDFRQAPIEVIDLGDRLLALAHVTATGLSSGASSEIEIAYLVRISGGQVTHERLFLSHAEARGAAGIAE